MLYHIPMDEWTTTGSIARELGVTVQWIGELCRTGRLPSATKMGGRWLVRKSDIDLIRNLKATGRPKKDKE